MDMLFKNACLQARGTLPPSVPPPTEGAAHSNQRMSDKPSVPSKTGGKKGRGQYLTVILHSLYEEHAVRLVVLFLWCTSSSVRL